jgi:hypothetical protein
MKTPNVSEYSLLVAGAGKLGQAIIEGTSGRFEETIVRNR